MPVPPPTTDHVAQALAELLSRYSSADRLRELVTIMVTQTQEAEDAGQELLTDRLLVNAEGVQLDIYGKIVGDPAAWRGALDDDDYRLMIEVAIQVNQSDGNAEQAIQIMATLVGVPVEYTGYQPAHYQLLWLTNAPASADLLQRINEIMPRITISGASWELVQGVGSDNVFRYDTVSQGYDEGQLASRVDT
jgi:hypothetical protein